MPTERHPSLPFPHLRPRHPARPPTGNEPAGALGWDKGPHTRPGRAGGHGLQVKPSSFPRAFRSSVPSGRGSKRLEILNHIHSLFVGEPVAERVAAVTEPPSRRVEDRPGLLRLVLGV